MIGMALTKTDLRQLRTLINAIIPGYQRKAELEEDFANWFAEYIAKQQEFVSLNEQMIYARRSLGDSRPVEKLEADHSSGVDAAIYRYLQGAEYEKAVELINKLLE